MLRVLYEKWGQTPNDLREIATKGAHARTRERFMALYMIARGTATATSWAAATGRHVQSVIAWVHKYNDEGPEHVAFGGVHPRTAPAGTLEWSERYSVGVAAFDGHHKELLLLLDSYLAAMLDGDERGNAAQTIREFVGKTRLHFAAEEELMRLYGYPETATHAQEHARLLSRAVALQDRAGAAVETMQFLKDWLENHLQASDRKYTAFFAAKGVT